MTAKNRWNSQRFIERVPEAELEWKMTVYRKDLQQFQRNQRLERAKLWNFLFRSNRELNHSIVTRYSIDDVLSGRVSVDDLKKMDVQQQPPVSTIENDRQFEAFKTQLSAQLKLSDSDRVWHELQRPNYEDLRRADYRPSLKDLNDRNVSRLLLDETFFSQLLHRNEYAFRDADARNEGWTINGQLAVAELSALTDGVLNSSSSSSSHQLPTRSKTTIVDESARSGRRFNRAVVSSRDAARVTNAPGDVERRRATEGDWCGGHFDGQVAEAGIASCLDDAGFHPTGHVQAAGETPSSLPRIVELTVENTSSSAASRASSVSQQRRQSEPRLPQIVK